MKRLNDRKTESLMPKNAINTNEFSSKGYVQVSGSTMKIKK